MKNRIVKIIDVKNESMIPWQVHGTLRNENAGYDAPLDYYLAGFKTKETAIEYCKIMGYDYE